MNYKDELKRLIKDGKISSVWDIDLNNLESAENQINILEKEIDKETDYKKLVSLIKKRDGWRRLLEFDVELIKAEVDKHMRRRHVFKCPKCGREEFITVTDDKELGNLKGVFCGDFTCSNDYCIEDRIEIVDTDGKITDVIACR